MAYEMTPTGWYATFDPTKSHRGIVQLPVVAWSSEDAALVVNAKRGHLQAVTTMAGFTGLSPCRSLHSVIPAQPGWYVTLVVDDVEQKLDIVGWAIDNDGEGIPLVPDAEGIGPITGWERESYAVHSPET
uniref:hypothetical protein n=1 Tax=Amycolatopsis sp. CA-290885 TaxID=3239925 RepID=UPI003F492E99